MSKTLALAILLVAPVAVAGEAVKTAEQQFKNILVFKGVPASQIDATMDVMAGALGVGCEHCHVKADKPGVPWPMEKDDKQAKRTARKMVTMMEKINKDFFGGNQDGHLRHLPQRPRRAALAAAARARRRQGRGRGARAQGAVADGAAAPRQVGAGVGRRGGVGQAQDAHEQGDRRVRRTWACAADAGGDGAWRRPSAGTRR